MEKDRGIPGPELPDEYADLVAQPELADAWNLEVSERRAQAAKVERLLAYKHRKTEESSGAHALTRRTRLKAVYRDAAILLGKSESTVRRVLETAEFLSTHLPQTWQLYLAGRIDLDRAQKAAGAAADLVETTVGKDQLRVELLSTVDQELAECAPQSNDKTLNHWLKQRVAELDPAGHQERYTRAKARRRVDFHHLPEGMSRIEALLPTVVVQPLEKDLHRAVRNMARRTEPGPGPEDPAASTTQPRAEEGEERTYAQRMADVFSEWVMNGRAGTPAGAGAATLRSTGGRITILVPAETLTRESDAPAVSEDRSYTLPAEEVRRLAEDPTAGHEFYGAQLSSESDGEPKITRVVKFGKNNPLQQLRATMLQLPNLLDIASSSRFFAGNLKRAIAIRDGTCQAYGCTEPGSRSEIDHKIAHERGGATSGENSVVLCRDHHGMKGLGLLPEVTGEASELQKEVKDETLRDQTGRHPPPAWVRTPDHRPRLTDQQFEDDYAA